MNLSKRLRRTLGWLAALSVLALYVSFFVVPAAFDAVSNGVANKGPYSVSAKADSLHRLLSVVDLHSDLLLWNRDPRVRADRGHVDVPRMVQGNVALEVFSAVTKTPKSQNTESNSGETDAMVPLMVLQRWPMATWTSPLARALYQSEKLHRAAERSNGQLRVILTEADLDKLLDDRANGAPVVGGLLAIEGLQAMEGTMDGYRKLLDAGYRMMSIAHFFDTELGGSAHGVEKGGLTDLGRAVIRQMESDAVIVDLAHVSATSINEILDLVTKPVVVSHTGVQGTCPGTRNLSDEQLDRIAANGGVVGIGFWATAVCGLSTSDIVSAMRYVADRVGVEHVALGSDFDGTVETYFHAGGLALLTDELLDQGFSYGEVRLIMGGNALRVMRDVLE